MPPPVAQTGKYRDGTYTGDPVDVFYGTVQVKAVISGGMITDVIFLSYPNSRSTSQQISNRAMSKLTQEAIASQSAQVAVVSGATDTTQGFIESLQSALNKAA